MIPGKATALAISPDGNYCVAAVNETIYIWQICTGRMMAVLSRHYQTVTVIKFIDDGSHFVSAGQDGMLLVWKLSNVLCAQEKSNHETMPLYSFSDHALPITDLALGKGGIRSLLLTVSLDRTCKLYDLASGALLLNLVFPEALSSVAIDHLETKVYTGTIDGNIFEFSLQSPPRMKEYHVSNESLGSQNRFIGHTGRVTTLSVSLDGESLLSGSVDESVRLWHIPSKQLIRTIPHKGTITNAEFMLTPSAMFDQEKKLQLLTNHFKRMIDGDASTDESQIIEILVTHPPDTETLSPSATTNIFTCGPMSNGSSNENNSNKESISGHNEPNEIENLRAEVSRLKKVNKELYEFAVNKVLKST